MSIEYARLQSVYLQVPLALNITPIILNSVLCVANSPIWGSEGPSADSCSLPTPSYVTRPALHLRLVLPMVPFALAKDPPLFLKPLLPFEDYNM